MFGINGKKMSDEFLNRTYNDAVEKNTMSAKTEVKVEEQAAQQNVNSQIEHVVSMNLKKTRIRCYTKRYFVWLGFKTIVEIEPFGKCLVPKDEASKLGFS